MIETIFGEALCVGVIETIFGEALRVGVIETIFGVAGRLSHCCKGVCTGTVEPIFSECASSENREGQGQDQFAFHGGAPWMLGDVSRYGFHATPINLIKKRKNWRLKIELVDCLKRALSVISFGMWVGANDVNPWETRYFPAFPKMRPRH